MSRPRRAAKPLEAAPRPILKTQREVAAALRPSYPKSSWAMFEYVQNATGSNATRTADMIAVSLWPSRGLTIHGFEIKVSRNDVLRELKAPGKADPIARYCDFWWLAVGSADLVRIEELEERASTWGLLVPVAHRHGTRMRVVKPAKPLNPIAIDRNFAFALLRRAAETFDHDKIRAQERAVSRAKLQEEIEAEMKEDHAAALAELGAKLEAATQRMTTLESQINTLVAAPMIYDPGTMARAIRLLSTLHGWRGADTTLGHTIENLDRDITQLGDVRRSLQKAHDIAQILADKRLPPGEGETCT